MIIFYSGEENRSIPEDIEHEMAEYLLPDATIMLTYWIHCRGDKPSMRFRKLREVRMEMIEEDIQEEQKPTGKVERVRLF